MPRVLSIILGGGKGTRLYPLTSERSKPAVPFGGKYRIIDIAISNCINSNFKQVYVLTQFNSASLHTHIAHGYRFDSFSKGFVEILAAEQTLNHSGWFEGTADAVRKNLIHFKDSRPDYYIILSGDQLYQMSLRDFLDEHISSGAAISIATTNVTREAASGFGIMKIDEKKRIQAFKEKPPMDQNIDDWKIPNSKDPQGRDYLASMGIYIFNADVLEKSLDNEFTDFGKEIIPQAINDYLVHSYVYSGYWEDIGTIRSFYESNLDLAQENPKFNCYDEKNPIFSLVRDLPNCKMIDTDLNKVVTSAGCVLLKSKINNSVIGVRGIVRESSVLDGVVFMGADFYQTAEEESADIAAKRPLLGIGKNCRIKNAIIDKNVRIGDNCKIGVSGKTYEKGQHGPFYIDDGIIVIKKDSIIPSGTEI